MAKNPQLPLGGREGQGGLQGFDEMRGQISESRLLFPPMCVSTKSLPIKSATWVLHLKEQDIDDLLDKLRSASFEPDLIILDTLARLIAGADENSAQDMGRAVAGIDRLRIGRKATVVLIHHTVKTGKWEHGSGALRGAADVMIECSPGEANGQLWFKCDKMKDAEPFPTQSLILQLIALGEGRSSLVVTDSIEVKDGDPKTAWKALSLLEEEFGERGAAHKEWSERFMALTGQSLSTFNRMIKYFKDEGVVLYDRKRYFAKPKKSGVKCQEVSGQCHDTPHEGVTSPPF
jgi:hypothetical protein